MSTAENCILGIDFGGTKIAIAVAELDGGILHTARVPTDASRGAKQALSRAMEVAKDLVAQCGRTVAAVGIATPGAVRSGRIDLAPNVPGWESLSLVASVREWLGIDVVVAGNDVNAAALAELTSGALRDADPGLVLGLGTGVAAAVTVGGAVVTGRHGVAGELGYSLTGTGLIDPDAPHLEATFSGRALDTLAARMGVSDAADLDPRRHDAAGEEVADRLDELVRHLVTCCLLLDPQRVVLYGGVTQNEGIRERLVQQLRVVLPFVPEIVLSEFAGDAALVGAVTMARRAAAET